MKIMMTLMLFIFLTHCSTQSVKLGKRCTVAGQDGSFEKSFIWLVDKSAIQNFDKKINKENCKKNS